MKLRGYVADWAPREAAAEGDPPHLQHYRLVLARVTARQSGRYTCTSPGGTTHTVSVRVVSEYSRSSGWARVTPRRAWE